jgi:uncharacterized membrane protein YeaQ/YmgE (transglycosylase-associated protein family)
MIINVITWILLGAIAGWIASLIMRSDAEQGIAGNIVVGIVGALIGGFLSNLLGGPSVTSFNATSVFIATIGAVILLFVMRLIQRPHHSHHI